MAAEPAREWSDDQLKSDDLPKKDLIKFIQDNAANSVRWIILGVSMWYVYEMAKPIFRLYRCVALAGVRRC